MTYQSELSSQNYLEEARPWGTYVVLDESPQHKVKRISVMAGRRLSLQKHWRRSEHWFVTEGQGIATVGAASIPVALGTAVDVPAGLPHRMHNVGTTNLVFIEVQHGEYFGEDDIVRLEDDFGRCPDSRSPGRADDSLRGRLRGAPAIAKARPIIGKLSTRRLRHDSRL